MCIFCGKGRRTLCRGCWRKLEEQFGCGETEGEVMCIFCGKGRRTLCRGCWRKLEEQLRAIMQGRGKSK
jgi:predicted Fe-S protein YdhL (DUF1289 family)